MQADYIGSKFLSCFVLFEKIEEIVRKNANAHNNKTNQGHCNALLKVVGTYTVHKWHCLLDLIQNFPLFHRIFAFKSERNRRPYIKAEHTSLSRFDHFHCSALLVQ